MTTTTTRRTCDCDHGEGHGPCGAPTTARHWCWPWWVRHPLVKPKKRPAYLRLCEPCNSECHNRRDERW